MNQTIANMTTEELEVFVNQQIDKRLTASRWTTPQFDPQKAAEFHQWLKENRPPSESGPSVGEMIRQDRERDHE